MAKRGAAQGAPVEPGLIARALAGMTYAFTGRFPGWMGPGDPVPPVAPQDQRDSIAGRMFDYPFGQNISIRPRHNEAVSFDQMRQLSDGYDLMRLVIETRKDQLAKLEWQIRPKKAQAAEDPRCAEIQTFFETPDKENAWDNWLRMLLEDLLVIDAPTLYPRLTRGGDLYALEPVDGATIKRVIDERGRTPMPPDPAYQQIIKGMPAVDYTRDELIYRPRVVRTHKVYGYSPVEQVIMTVQIALRRQLSQLEFFTMGTMPDALASVPKDWTADQIRQFQMLFDEMLEGNTGERRKIRFIPDSVNYREVKPAPLKDEFDEWLARVVCFAFSVSAQPFIKEMNRATAETAKDSALQEGLAPLQLWVKSLMDTLILRYWKAPDLEFRWTEEDVADPLIQAQVSQIYLNAKVLHPDEVRADLGRPPLTDEQKEDLKGPELDEFGLPIPPHGGQKAPAAGEEGPQGANGGEDEGTQGEGEKDDAEAKEASAGLGKFRRLRPIARERYAIRRIRRRLAAATERFLAEQAARMAEQLVAAMGLTDPAPDLPVHKAEASPGLPVDLRSDEVDRILGQLDFSEWATTLPGVFGEALAAAAVLGGGEALAQLGLTDDLVTGLMRRRAEAWARERAAELVGMRVLADGRLVVNPVARWQITEGTREFLRSAVTQAIDEGWSAQTLRSAVLESVAFDGDRAMVIARTEIARADTAGSMEGYRASGLVVGKRWLTAQDEKVSDECRLCEDAGVIPLDAKFPTGEDAPPNHPNCRCAVLPVLEGEM